MAWVRMHVVSVARPAFCPHVSAIVSALKVGRHGLKSLHYEQSNLWCLISFLVGAPCRIVKSPCALVDKFKTANASQMVECCNNALQSDP